MLTKKQNLLETIRGGNPDRYVNQFEAFKTVRGSPYDRINPRPKEGQLNVVNAWGVTFSYPQHVPASFPVHDAEHTVLKDITHWRDYVKVPPTQFPDSEWEPYEKLAEEIDTNEYFRTVMVAPGLFEMCHHLMGMQDALINFSLEPECMKDLIKVLTERELAWAEQLCIHIRPEAILHHDDWGSRMSTFLSPEMFDEFFLDGYKQIYGYYHNHGVQVVIHHSDSYAANLVPSMIEMGVDIWQGCMRSNNIPAMLEKYGGKISFMSGIDNQDIEDPDWNEERVRAVVKQAVDEGSKHYFIPCMATGGPGAIYPGLYEAVSAEIDRINLTY